MREGKESGGRGLRRTEQFNLEPDLRQSLYEVRRLLGRDVPAVPPEHVQPVGPVRPARDVRSDRVGQRPLWRDEREGLRGCDERRRASRAASSPRAVHWRRGAVPGRDFGDEREVEPVGQVLEPAPHRELGLAVDVVQVFQAVILQRRCRMLASERGMCAANVEKGNTHETHESPWPCGPPWRRCGDWDRVEEPRALQETVDALLANELLGFLVKLCAQVANGYFAQQVVLLFELFHLSLAHAAILAIREVLHHLVPGA